MVLIYWSIKDIVEIIEGCVENDFDFILMAEGKRGTGKSTILYKIADRIGRRGVVHFNPNVCLVYSRDEIKSLLANREKTVIFPDELINATYKRDFFQQEQKEIIKGLNMYRDSHNVFLGAIPDFRDLDGDMRKLTKIRISVIRRGIAEIRIQPKFEDFLQANEIRRKMTIKEKQDLKMEPNRKVGLLIFTDLTNRQKKTYKDIKKKKRGIAYGTDEDLSLNPMQDWYKKLFERVIEKEVTSEALNTIARMAGKNPSAVRQRLHTMLRDSNKDRLSSYIIKTEKVKEEVKYWNKL